MCKSGISTGLFNQVKRPPTRRFFPAEKVLTDEDLAKRKEDGNKKWTETRDRMQALRDRGARRRAEAVSAITP